MLRDLPEESRWSAHNFNPEEYFAESTAEGPREIDWVAERRAWGNPDRQLAALTINLLGDLRAFVPQWKKGKEPHWDPIGPPEFRGEGNPTAEKRATVEDAMRHFGFAG